MRRLPGLRFVITCVIVAEREKHEWNAIESLYFRGVLT